VAVGSQDWQDANEEGKQKPSRGQDFLVGLSPSQARDLRKETRWVNKQRNAIELEVSEQGNKQ
jgi:hypothetical protein